MGLPICPALTHLQTSCLITKAHVAKAHVILLHSDMHYTHKLQYDINKTMALSV